MSEPTTIMDEDVRWEYKPGDVQFEKEAALARLLADNAVFLNSHWWEESWPEEARRRPSLNVNCNDVFAWAAADAEPMNYEDIEDVYAHWEKDPIWGTGVWCAKRRKCMPQQPVCDEIKQRGIWDLDAMDLGQRKEVTA